MARDPIDIFQLIDMQGPDECWSWAGSWGGRARDKRPYWMCNGRRTMAYRWVWELVNGRELQDFELVLHSCDRGGWPTGCSNPNHLSIGTHQQNMNDMTDRQRHGLPATVVRAIRRLLDDGQSQEEIAKLYGLTRETVSAIKNKRAYKHVEDANGTGTV